MDTLRTRLVVFAQLVAGTTVSNYLDTSPNAMVSTTYAQGLVGTFRAMYYHESPQGAWGFIKQTIDNFLEYYFLSRVPFTKDEVQLVRDAITGVETLTETYQADPLYVGTIRIAITHWEQRIRELQSVDLKVNRSTPSYLAMSGGLGDSYSASIPSSVVEPVIDEPVPVIDPLDFGFFKLSKLTTNGVDTESTTPVLSSTDTEQVLFQTKLGTSQNQNGGSELILDEKTEPSTPVLDELNLTVNTIAALSQAKVEIVSRAQQRWLDTQQC